MWSLAGLRKRAVAVAPRRRRRPRRRNRRRMAPTKFGFGAALPRKEDDALLRGAGRYVADHAPEETLHAVLLRSPHAHARFRITDVGKAAAMPGVALVLSAQDTASLGDLPCQGEIPGTDIVVPPYPVLARDEVRHVGDAIAFVVADTPEKARDAAEAISVEWEPVAPMIGAAAALAPNALPVWPKTIAPRGNLAFETEIGDAESTTRAFAKAARTVSLSLVNQRLVANYLDTRGVVAEHDGERLTLTLSSQGSHAVRDVLCRDVLKIPADKMRVVTPDVGGGFGTKLFPYREYALAAFAARRLGRPVKWIADRSEHFLGDAQGRGIAPEELGGRNFITAMPYTTPTGKTYDSGEPARHLRRAQEGADWNGFERRAGQTRAGGGARG